MRQAMPYSSAARRVARTQKRAYSARPQRSLARASAHERGMWTAPSMPRIQPQVSYLGKRIESPVRAGYFEKR